MYRDFVLMPILSQHTSGSEQTWMARLDWWGETEPKRCRQMHTNLSESEDSAKQGHTQCNSSRVAIDWGTRSFYHPDEIAISCSRPPSLGPYLNYCGPGGFQSTDVALVLTHLTSDSSWCVLLSCSCIKPRSFYLMLWTRAYPSRL